MEKNPDREVRSGGPERSEDPVAENRDQTDEADSGETTQPVDGPGGDENGKGATSQDEPG